jgi:hypothetical protein
MFFTIPTGSGSASDDLSDRRAISASTSATVKWKKAGRQTPSEFVEYVGVGEPEVNARRRFTYVTK